MKYPQIPHDRKRSVKLTLTEIKKIKELYNKGETTSALGREYGVHYLTIRYWVDEDYKKHQNEKSQKNCMNRYYTDLSFQQQMKTNSSKNSLDRRKRFPEIKKYHNFMAKRYKKPKEEIKKQHKIRYEKNSSKFIQSSLKWNKDNPERHREINRRYERAKDFTGFRMFIKGTEVNKP